MQTCLAIKIRGALNDNRSSLVSPNDPHKASDQQLLGFVRRQIGPIGKGVRDEQCCAAALVLPTPRQMQALRESLASRGADGLMGAAACTGVAMSWLSPTQKKGNKTAPRPSSDCFCPCYYSSSRARNIAASSDSLPPSSFLQLWFGVALSRGLTSFTSIGSAGMGRGRQGSP